MPLARRRPEHWWLSVGAGLVVFSAWIAASFTALAVFGFVVMNLALGWVLPLQLLPGGLAAVSRLDSSVFTWIAWGAAWTARGAVALMTVVLLRRVPAVRGAWLWIAVAQAALLIPYLMYPTTGMDDSWLTVG